MADIPGGFEPHFRSSPLTDPWEPLYSRVTEEAVILGLRASEQHCNGRGFVHGGLISALADNAMGLSCARRHDKPTGLVTVSLNLEFLRAARRGEWLGFSTTYVKTGRRLDFAQGQVSAAGQACALMTASFAVPD